MSNQQERETAAEFYRRAERDGVYLECDCTGVSIYKWEELMKGAVRADKKKLLKAIGLVDEYYNPYEFYRTKTHLIYVHSAIEHFYRINT